MILTAHFVIIQMKTNCKMHVKQDFPDGVPRQLMMSGTPAAIANAKAMALRVMELGPLGLQPDNGNTQSIELDCPQALVGRVIGTSGVVRVIIHIEKYYLFLKSSICIL